MVSSVITNNATSPSPSTCISPHRPRRRAAPAATAGAACLSPALSRSSSMDDKMSNSGQSTTPTYSKRSKCESPVMHASSKDICYGRLNERSLALLEDRFVIDDVKEEDITVDVISEKDGMPQKIQVKGCSVFRVGIEEYCYHRSVMVDYILELTLNGVYYRAPHNSFVRIHDVNAASSFISTSASSNIMALPPTCSAATISNFVDSQISSPKSTASSSLLGNRSLIGSIPLKYQVLLEGMPKPSAEFNVLKFSTGSIVRSGVERYRELNGTDFNTLTVDEPRRIFEILGQKLFPEVKSSNVATFLMCAKKCTSN